ncbi:hypothetical protein EV193_104173 [Herbihabitans rhizosphaerae]|uniref:Uncharacterized protein n=1 Tax=Herbihabitans rhizosphaerae TaxID=1872711 RepID=A0A4Q7KU25_9PSEU|nr:hypothetical protein [Herbihabitans rhizosphaerae]RZS38962.1 hypothetical protein EV193_104173 [Herbihabitans rhizosphaerae]
MKNKVLAGLSAVSAILALCDRIQLSTMDSWLESIAQGERCEYRVERPAEVRAEPSGRAKVYGHHNRGVIVTGPCRERFDDGVLFTAVNSGCPCSGYGWVRSDQLAR